MEVVSITPAIRVIKESNISECDMYIAFRDNIRVTDIEGRVFAGIFLYIDLAKNEKEYDSIILSIGSESIKVPCSDIVDIEEI